jgi:hypothetical protein
MKNYRKISEDSVSFDDTMDLSNDDLFGQEAEMRSILAKISVHAEKTNIREYRVVVYAKKRDSR